MNEKANPFAEWAQSKSVRVTLTKSQLQEPEIQTFAALLLRIASDGTLDRADLEALTDWLNAHNESAVPAVKFLFDLLMRICADGRITDEEVFEIQLAIERILPKDFRAMVTGKRKEAYYSQSASEAQLNLIAQQTGTRPDGLTRAQASEAIEANFSNPRASNRQLMFLRFWNQMDVAQYDRRQIAEWMDNFIAADHRRWAAWNLYKEVIDDDGGQNDPTLVPLGEYVNYLPQVS